MGENRTQTLSAIIPVFNEESTVADLLVLVTAEAFFDQIIVVDDGSSDGSLAEIKPFLSDPRVTLVRHDTNQGKGAAIRSAIPHVISDLVIIQDADLEYSPKDIAKLKHAMEQGQGDFIIGSRRLNPYPLILKLLPNYLFVGFLNFLFHLIYNATITDEASCYKLMSTRDLRRMQLESNGFEFCSEVVAKAARMDLEIFEVPIRFHPRSYAEGKKIRPSDAITAIRTLLKYRKWQPELALDSSQDRSA